MWRTSRGQVATLHACDAHSPCRWFVVLIPRQYVSRELEYPLPLPKQMAGGTNIRSHRAEYHNARTIRYESSLSSRLPCAPKHSFCREYGRDHAIECSSVQTLYSSSQQSETLSAGDTSIDITADAELVRAQSRRQDVFRER